MNTRAGTRYPDDMALQRRAMLAQAIHKLAPAYRWVIALKFFEHCSTGQIAAALHCSEGNVRVLQHQALVELQRIIGHAVT